MKFVLDWLEEYCEWDWPLDELVERLTMSGTEVEGVESTGFDLDGFVVAQVESFQQHPNADRLRLCKVNDGEAVRQIVCGASNFKDGDKVALAQPGALMPAGFKIKKSKLRGELSEGMMCSAEELGLPVDEEEKGILILDADFPVGKALRECFSGDTVVECEVTPNRSDLLSYRGMSREMAALGARVTDFSFPDGPECTSSHPEIQLAIDDVAGCPRYTATKLVGVQVGPSPDWMRQRLTAAGLRPVNNVVDITNYVLLETGQPLHAFDLAKLAGNTIGVRRAKEGESLLALDGNTYSLEASDLVIADEAGPVAIAGVMGGEETGVTNSTTSVLLESARFFPADVRATSRRLGLMSDSSYRFERGVDPAAVNLAAARAIQLLVEHASATVDGPTVESAACDIEDQLVPLRLSRISTVLGFEVSDERVQGILQPLGCRRVGSDWLVPSYRLDLRREADLIEEIARFEGLKAVESALPPGASPLTRADQRYDAEAVLRQRLNGWGFFESLTGSLVPRKEGPSRIGLLNPLVTDAAELRDSLLEALLPCVRHNLGRGNEDLKLFEIGTVYQQHKKHMVEKRQLVVVGTGKADALHWSREQEDFGFFQLKGVAAALESEFETIRLAGKDSGPGLVSPKLLKSFGIKVPVWFAEWDISKLKLASGKTYSPLADYPAVKRDFAFVVDRTISSADVEKAILSTGIAELESVCCFDVFSDESGQKLDKDKKSLAYALTYRSPERTLKDKEVVAWDRKVVEAVEKAVGATLR